MGANTWDDVIVTERFFRWSEFKKALDEGRIREVFGTGTSSNITVLGKLLDRVSLDRPFHAADGQWLDIPVCQDEADSISHRLCDELHAIKHEGKAAPNDEKWLFEVE